MVVVYWLNISNILALKRTGLTTQTKNVKWKPFKLSTPPGRVKFTDSGLLTAYHLGHAVNRTYAGSSSSGLNKRQSPTSAPGPAYSANQLWPAPPFIHVRNETKQEDTQAAYLQRTTGITITFLLHYTVVTWSSSDIDPPQSRFESDLTSCIAPSAWTPLKTRYFSMIGERPTHRHYLNHLYRLLRSKKKRRTRSDILTTVIKPYTPNRLRR